ncbi:hypothetical protein LWI29_029778 [Acer saccharum]|uniref:RNase H type-1 domain-containing protein n=1 Tax=Acer saccharum TaxID=4024 RepID=A0AA39VU21_ACESA|nr:hypothetical protein LWI29_029778 [Acer saccharum]
MDKFVRCSVLRISREHNSQADALAKLASSSELKLSRTVTIFRLLESSITEESVVHAVIPEYGTDGDTWMTPIMKFLQDGALPEEKSASLRVRRQSPRYLLINRVLYRRGYSLPYLRCIAPPQTDLVLQEVHGGTCDSGSTACGNPPVPSGCNTSGSSPSVWPPSWPSLSSNTLRVLSPADTGRSTSAEILATDSLSVLSSDDVLLDDSDGLGESSNLDAETFLTIAEPRHRMKGTRTDRPEYIRIYTEKEKEEKKKKRKRNESSVTIVLPKEETPRKL